MTHQPTIYVASAGTGKTTALIETLKNLLEEGAKPEEILFTTFTNAGASELLERTLAAIPNNTYRTKQFLWFRTLHSISYRNIPHKKMVTAKDCKHFGFLSKWPMTGGQMVSTSDGSLRKGAMAGDILMQLVQLMRNKRCTPEAIASTQTASQFTPAQIREFNKAYAEYREEIGKYDFTDQLEQFLASVKNYGCPFPVSHIIVDEAQDLSNLQWEIINEIHQQEKIPLIIAGDDKQSIYEFSGACPNTLIDTEGERIVLDTSYRVPKNILGFTEQIANRISRKQKYKIQSQQEGGFVQRINHIGNLNLDEGSWFFLVRNRFMMGMIENEIVNRGHPVQSDNVDSIFKPELLQAICDWKELIVGFEKDGASLQKLAQYLPTKKAIRYGFMKHWNSLHEDEYFSWDALAKDYGLLTKRPWNEVFTLPENTKKTLTAMDQKGILSNKPTIRISTIHGVKGQEADNVVVYPDLSIQTMRGYEKNPDIEHRCFYVAVTRARKNLYLHEPFTECFYEL